jgi:hypothetical protein
VTIIGYKCVTDNDTCQLRLLLWLQAMAFFLNLQRSYLQRPLQVKKSRVHRILRESRVLFIPDNSDSKENDDMQYIDKQNRQALLFWK